MDNEKKRMDSARYFLIPDGVPIEAVKKTPEGIEVLFGYPVIRVPLPPYDITFGYTDWFEDDADTP